MCLHNIIYLCLIYQIFFIKVSFDFLFFLFSSIILTSALVVISARNPIHSVLFLILVFVNVIFILLYLEVEFLALTFVIVYVGAVAVLFLFVVMMLNVAQQKNQWFGAATGSKHIPVGMVVSLIIFFELLIVIGGWKLKPDLSNDFINLSTTNITNTHSIGNILYTDYIHLFQLSGMILLVAMIGAIVLTFRQRSGLKRQSYIRQISREKNDGVELVDVKNEEIND